MFRPTIVPKPVKAIVKKFKKDKKVTVVELQNEHDGDAQAQK